MKSASLEIIAILKNAGHEAFWAGGCVRDMLLGIEPKDFDIVTSAKPEEIEALLEKTIPIGKQFGVIMTIHAGHHFEIATFRSDSGYSDGRRPDSVEFKTAKEDALRRDFTINGMFYDPTTDQIIDYVDGQKDLQEKLIRFIGDSENRILEDHLRILRAIRFKNAYNFQYHPETYAALKKHIALISKISPDRLRDELNKIIASANASQAFEELFELGALEIIIPQLAKLKGLAQPLQYHQEGDVFDHALRSLKALRDEEAGPDPLPAQPPSSALLWAVLLHDIGKYDTFAVEERIRYNKHAEVGAEIAKSILTRLNFPRRVIERVHWLIEHHMMIIALLQMPAGRRRSWFLKPGFPELLEVYRADIMGTIPCDLSAYHELKKLYNHEIAALKLLPPQLLSGEEIMQICQLPPGPEVGDLLEQIREKQLAGEIKTKEEAIRSLKTLKNL